MRASTSHFPRRQRGVTLIVVLILLTVVTIIGIGGARIALLGERSTRFDRDYQLAWQAAEAALMDAEYDIRGPNTHGSQRLATFTQELNRIAFVPSCGDTTANRGLCDPVVGATPIWQTVDFLDMTVNRRVVQFGEFTGRAFDTGTIGVRPEIRPRYIVEQLVDPTPGKSAGGAGGKEAIYRITAMGFGPSTDVQVMLQTSFKKDF